MVIHRWCGILERIKVAPDLIQQVDLNETRLLNAGRGYISEKLSKSLSAQEAHPNISNMRNSPSDNGHMD